MTTTIVPANGAGVIFTQQGVGTSPGYSAIDIRRASLGVLVEGVLGTSTLVTAGGVSNVAQADFFVTQRNAGANMSVDVNMPSGGFGWVQGDAINGQGLYMVPVHASNINEVISAADPTNPRIDQVILEIQDNALDASGGNLSRTRVLTGTATSGATLVNRTGAAALPGSALLLADVLVPAGSSSIPNGNINDRRKWATGINGWTPLTLASSCVQFGSYVPSARLNGDVVRLKGSIQNNTGGTITGGTMATLPAGMRPLSSLTYLWSATTITLAGTTGTISPTSLVNGGTIQLDGMTFTTN